MPTTATRRDRTVLMVGETMLVLQKVEQFLLAVLLGMVTPSEADQKLQSVLLRDKETLGRLLNYFADRVTLPVHFAETFRDLLARRNLFVHNLVLAPWFDLKTEKGCDVLEDYTQEMQTAAKTVLQVLLAVGVDESAVIRSQDARKRYAHILARIQETAEPDFGGLTEAQYFAKVLVNTKASYKVKHKKI